MVSITSVRPSVRRIQSFHVSATITFPAGSDATSPAKRAGRPTPVRRPPNSRSRRCPPRSLSVPSRHRSAGFDGSRYQRCTRCRPCSQRWNRRDSLSAGGSPVPGGQDGRGGEFGEPDSRSADAAHLEAGGGLLQEPTCGPVTGSRLHGRANTKAGRPAGGGRFLISVSSRAGQLPMPNRCVSQPSPLKNRRRMPTRSGGGSATGRSHCAGSHAQPHSSMSLLRIRLSNKWSWTWNEPL